MTHLRRSLAVTGFIIVLLGGVLTTGCDRPSSDLDLFVDGRSVPLTDRTFNGAGLYKDTGSNTARLVQSLETSASADGKPDFYRLDITFDLGFFQGLKAHQTLQIEGVVSGESPKTEAYGLWIDSSQARFEPGPRHTPGVVGLLLQRRHGEDYTDAGTYSYDVSATLTVDAMEWVEFSAGDQPKLSARIDLRTKGGLPPEATQPGVQTQMVGKIGAGVDTTGW